MFYDVVRNIGVLIKKLAMCCAIVSDVLINKIDVLIIKILMCLLKIDLDEFWVVQHAAVTLAQHSESMLHPEPTHVMSTHRQPI